MTRSVNRLAWVLLAILGLLVGNLQYQQLLRGDDLALRADNRRALIERFASERGVILLGDEPAARSVRTDDQRDDLLFRRRYPLAPRAAHVIGWSSTVVGTSGVERAYDAALTPGGSDVLSANLAELLGEGEAVGDTVRLTLVPAVQAAAERALGDRPGAVVALDPSTGAVLAHASAPAFDAGPLADPDLGAALAAWEAYRTDDAEPLLDRAARELYPPGSTFKLVVAAAALEQGLDPTTAFDDTATFTPDVGQPIRNSSETTCDGGGRITLARALEVSCNVVFGQLATELGTATLSEQAQRFGFDRRIPYDLPSVVSTYPNGDLDAAQLAQTGLGQFDVRATALQMAVVGAAIANDGVLVRPTIVRDVLDDTAATVGGPQQGPWDESGFPAQAVSSRTAEQLQQIMVDTVLRGTGQQARIADVTVGGKTGTAQDPSDPTATAWFVGFAEQRVAVAVVVPDAGGGGGGAVAAPIARQVMEAALGV